MKKHNEELLKIEGMPQSLLDELHGLLPKPTNYRRLSSMSLEEMAEDRIRVVSTPDFDLDYDDNWYHCRDYDEFVTDDGQKFGDREEAIKHELWWLQQEVELENNK